MPFLDAKALETDPDGMAFLRAVLRQDAGPASPARPHLERPEAALPFEVPPLPGAAVSLGPIPREVAPAPAA
jgi:hypothetical protein